VEIRLVGISSSPRKGNTEHLVRTALEAAEESPVPVTTSLVSFVGKRIEPCTDCQVCATQGRPCIKRDDWAELVDEITNPVPNGVLIASPVYFFSANAQLRAFFDRCTSLLKGHWVEDHPFPPPDFSKTAAAAMAVGFHRHGGVEHTMSNILHWFLTTGFVCTGVDYIGAGAWQQHVNSTDAVLQDDLGMRNARIAGRAVAHLAYLLAAGSAANPDVDTAFEELRREETAL